MQRRDFLKGMALGSGLLAGSGSLLAAGSLDLSKQQRPLWLQGGSSLDAAIARGLADLDRLPATLAPLDTAVSDPRGWQQLLRQHKGRRLFGALTPANYWIFDDLVRTEGGQLIVRGEHHWQSAGNSHHQWLTTPQAQGLGGLLKAKGGQSLTSTEQLLGPIQAAHPQAAPLGRSSWPEQLGIGLALVAANQWRAQALPPTQSPARPSNLTAAESLVSFVVQA